MKKTVAVLATAIAIFSFGEIKRYKAEFTEQEINELLYVVEKSNAEHQLVVKVKDHLITEFKPQFQKSDTTKPKK